MKLLLCFSTENSDGLCASFDVSEWQPSCFEHISRSSYESQLSIPISKRSGDMLIREWKKCMDSRKEVLGRNIMQKERIGDRIISILHNGESGVILFFSILP